MTIPLFDIQLANWYGPDGVHLDRKDRIKQLQDAQTKLQAEIDRDREAHLAQCDECRNGEFCLDILTWDKRYDKLHFLSSAIEAERFDAPMRPRLWSTALSTIGILMAGVSPGKGCGHASS